MREFPKDGDVPSEPPVYLSWRDYSALFGAEQEFPDFSDRRLTNYQAVIVKLHGTWEANKASAHANSELIKALRKKIKKAKRHLK